MRLPRSFATRHASAGGSWAGRSASRSFGTRRGSVTECASGIGTCCLAAPGRAVSRASKPTMRRRWMRLATDSRSPRRSTSAGPLRIGSRASIAIRRFEQPPRECGAEVASMVDHEQNEHDFISHLIDDPVATDCQLAIAGNAELFEFRRHGAESRLLYEEPNPVAQFRKRAGPCRGVEARDQVPAELQEITSGTRRVADSHSAASSAYTSSASECCPASSSRSPSARSFSSARVCSRCS